MRSFLPVQCMAPDGPHWANAPVLSSSSVCSRSGKSMPMESLGAMDGAGRAGWLGRAVGRPGGRLLALLRRRAMRESGSGVTALASLGPARLPPLCSRSSCCQPRAQVACHQPHLDAVSGHGAAQETIRCTCVLAWLRHNSASACMQAFCMNLGTASGAMMYASPMPECQYAARQAAMRSAAPWRAAPTRASCL